VVLAVHQNKEDLKELAAALTFPKDSVTLRLDKFFGMLMDNIQCDTSHSVGDKHGWAFFGMADEFQKNR